LRQNHAWLKFTHYVVRFEEMQRGFSATFDKQNRLIALQGVHLGYNDRRSNRQ
jgi:hypothetical protein